MPQIRKPYLPPPRPETPANPNPAKAWLRVLRSRDPILEPLVEAFDQRVLTCGCPGWGLGSTWSVVIGI